MESQTWNMGIGQARISLNKYQAGSGAITVEYKTGDTEANCDADSWHAYAAPFDSQGWVKIKVS